MPESDNNLTLGAHKSAAGGFKKSVERVAEITGNCMQLFSYSPRSWQARDLSEEDAEAFLRLAMS